MEEEEKRNKECGETYCIPYTWFRNAKGGGEPSGINELGSAKKKDIGIRTKILERGIFLLSLLGDFK